MGSLGRFAGNTDCIRIAPAIGEIEKKRREKRGDKERKSC